MVDTEKIRAVKERHGAAIMAKENVVGMGVGYKETKGIKTDRMALVVMVRKKVSVKELKERDVIPAEIEGVVTDVIEVGEIVALQARTDRWRPAPGGVSIGHYKITAGTLGVLVRDAETNEMLILSNNHVMANSNDATRGDPILQPGPHDGGTVAEDTIAHLVRFASIQFESEPSPSPCSFSKAVAEIVNFLAGLVGSRHRLLPVVVQQANQVDGALAKPVTSDVVSSEILEIGSVMEDAEAELGMQVKKSAPSLKSLKLIPNQIMRKPLLHTMRLTLPHYQRPKNLLFQWMRSASAYMKLELKNPRTPSSDGAVMVSWIVIS